MAIITGDIGDIAYIPLAFTDDDLAPADPTEAVLTVREPDGTRTVYRWPTPGVGETVLTHDDDGAFHADHPLTQWGVVTYRREGTGAVTAADEGYFFVRQPLLA